MYQFLKVFFYKTINNWCSSVRLRRKRLLYLSLIFGFGYFIIIFQLFKINYLSAENVEKKLFTQKTLRKNIHDRNGFVLATNLPTSSLYANPKKIKNIKEAIKSLKNIIPSIDLKNLNKQLTSNKNFVWIDRELTPKQKENIIALGINGLYFEDAIKRVYTQGSTTSHILGFVDRDNVGISGVEKYFDSFLSESNSDESLTLSIDYRVQNIVSEELDNTISKFSAIGGVGIVADVKTGEILSMVSKPDFNPVNLSKNSKESFFNKATLGNYEIGSVIKAISFAIAFDTKTIEMNDVYKIDEFTLRKKKIRDYHQDSGWKTVPQIFMKSSNIGSGIIAMEVGKEKYYDYIIKMGLSQKLSLEIPEISKPILPSINNVTDLRLVTMSYGYGFSMTPMHFVQGMIPVVNGGIFKPVTLLKKDILDQSGNKKIFSSLTSDYLVKLLRLTVEKGTGRKAEVKGYLVGGKTGTANKLGPNGSYLDNSRYSSFVAIAPSLDPKYIVYIFLDDPRGIKETFGFATAGFTAAPTAGRIISRIGALYGLEPYDEKDPKIKKLLKVDYEIDKKV